MSWNEFEISKQDLIAGVDLGYRDESVAALIHRVSDGKATGYWDPNKSAFIVQPTVIQPGVVIEEQPVRVITTTGANTMWQQQQMGIPPAQQREDERERNEFHRRMMGNLFPELTEDELREMYSKARGNRDREPERRRPRPDLLDRTTRDIMREFYEHLERNERVPVKTAPRPKKAKREEEPTDGEHLKPRRVVEV